jgi:hypothetical protein
MNTLLIIVGAIVLLGLIATGLMFPELRRYFHIRRM